MHARGWLDVGLGHRAMRARDVDAKDLGMRTIDGASLHAYSVTNPKSHKIDTVFLDNGGRITRVEGRGAVITISKFNTPMTIAAPI